MKKIYDEISADYQYKAMMEGGNFRKFWHAAKLSLFESKLFINDVKTVLDLGCGAGNASIYLSKNFGYDVFGVDIKDSYIKFCKKRAKKEKLDIDFRTFNGCKTDFEDETFDCVLSSEVIEHIENPKQHLKEAKRVLKDDGILLLTTPNCRSFWPILEYICDKFRLTPRMKGAQHVIFYDKKTLVKEMNKSGFEILEISSYYGWSPFWSVISAKAGIKSFQYEFLKKNCKRMILYVVARKK